MKSLCARMYLAFILIAASGCSSTTPYYTVRYPNLLFIGDSASSFHTFRASPWNGKMPEIYVRFRGVTYFLPDLPEAIAPQLRQSGFIAVDFQNGRVSDLVAKQELEIGNQKNGPFYKLPISEKNVIAMFGEPTKRERNSTRHGYYP